MVNEVVGSIVIPAFNEEEGIQSFLESLVCELTQYHSQHAHFRFHIVVVDDCSKDQTYQRVSQFFEANPHCGLSFNILRLPKNQGQQSALISGLQFGLYRTDFSITIDADGEQPVQFIPQLIDCWSKANSLVHTNRRRSNEITYFKRYTSFLFYNGIRLFTGAKISEGMADYKLWDHRSLRPVFRHLEHCGSTRIFATWLAPSAPVLEYEARWLKNRKSRYSLIKMLGLGSRAIRSRFMLQGISTN